MKKSILLLITAVMGASLALGGYSGASGLSPSAIAGQVQMEILASTGISSQSTEESAAAEEGSTTESTSGQEDPELTCQAGVRVGFLKGLTSMGLVSLMDKVSKGGIANVYEFTMAGEADELMGKIANGDPDIALVPVNVASVLYNKTQGNVTVLDINTLGVLYVVAPDDSIAPTAGLKGRSIYMIGKGTAPEHVMNYLLKGNGLPTSDVDLQFKSEAAEMASLLKEDSSAIGVLPQPFITTVCIRNPDPKTVLDLIEQWNLLNKDIGSMLVTGVTLARSNSLRENQAPVAEFLEEHTQPALSATEHIEEAAELIAAQGIVEKASVAQKALPYCNIMCPTGQEMKDALSGYLSTPIEQDPKPTGGQLPGDDFYYMPQSGISETRFMKQNTRLRKYLIWLFWIAVWQVVNMLIRNNIIFVGPMDTTLTLMEPVRDSSFWVSISNSFARISIGFLGAFVLGILLGSLAYVSGLIEELLEPIMLLIKSVFVASFVIPTLIWIGSHNLSVFTFSLVAVPMIYVNTLSGLERTDWKLLEMARVFFMSLYKQVRYIYIPGLLPYLISGCRTVPGMSWKFGVAAEVTDIPKGFIGEQFYYSKLYLDTAGLFAWTFVTIIVSVLFGYLLLYLLKKVRH